MGNSILQGAPGEPKTSPRKRKWCTLLFQNYSAFYSKSRVHHFRFPGCFRTLKKTPDVLRARGTFFRSKIARELTKSDGTRTIRSEIARGIVSNRSQGPEMDKMKVFDNLICMEVLLHPPRYDNSKGGSREKKNHNRGAILNFFSFVTLPQGSSTI